MPQADADLVVTLQADPAGPCLITVSGELDYHTGPRLRACLEEAPLGPGAALVLDLAGLTYCDSIGVAVLVHGYRRAEAAGAKLALAGTPADTFRLLRLTGLDRLFTTYDSVDAAIGALLPEPGDRDHLLQPDVRPGDPDPPLLHRTGGIPYGRATAGFNGTPDCGVTFIGPGTFNLTATLAWKTCWVPEAVDGPPPAQLHPGARCRAQSGRLDPRRDHAQDPVRQRRQLAVRPGERLRRHDGRGCCILSGVNDPFDFQALRIQQPGGPLADRANYEIFNADRQLLATATETDSHTRRKLLSKSMPDTRAIAITTAAGEPAGFLVKQSSEWITEFRGPGSELIGRIRTGATRRTYTLLGDQDEAVAQVTGDLALKNFSVAGPGGAVFARVRKTWAGLRKEMLTSSDHYTVEFSGPVSQPARTLTVMMPIVLDLTLYGPV